MKAKLDSEQVKNFLLHHVEKIVFGGFVAAFLLICVSAFKLKPYEKTPAELEKIAADVSQLVESKTPPAQFEGLPSVPDFTNLGAVGPAAVDPQYYAVTPMNLPYEERQELRKEPKLFALLELNSFCGYGGIAIGEPGRLTRAGNFGGGEGDMMGPGMAGMPGMDGGMMPPGGMGEGYQPPGYGQGQMGPGGMPGGMADGMAGAMPGGMMPGGMMPGGMMPGGGMPGYGGKQRPKSPSEKRREKEAARKAAAAAKAAARPKPKPVLAEKIVLTQAPSGSKVQGRYWVCLVGAVPYWKQLNEFQTTFRDARGFEPKRDYPRYILPRIERAEVAGNNAGDWEELDIEEAAEDFETWAAEYPEIVDKQFLLPIVSEPLPPLIFANHDKEKVTHRLTQVVEQKPVVTEEDEAAKKPKNRRTTAFGGGRTAPRGGMGQAMAGFGMQNRATVPVVEHRLFRFFDFKVDPGKTYRYRVKLVLRNPNGGVPPRFLENRDFAKGDTREADWSEPSPPVTVIAGNRLLAGTVSTPPGRSEPAGHLIAKLFNEDVAAEIRRKFDINRGSVLNELDAQITLSEGENSQARAATVNFKTNAVVLDMFGGDKIPGVRSGGGGSDQPKVPGHFLVLDNDGDLRTLVQSTDAGMYETEVEEAQRQSTPPDQANNPRPGGNNAAGTDGGFFDFDKIPEKGGKKGRR